MITHKANSTLEVSCQDHKTPSFLLSEEVDQIFESTFCSSEPSTAVKINMSKNSPTMKKKLLRTYLILFRFGTMLQLYMFFFKKQNHKEVYIFITPSKIFPKYQHSFIMFVDTCNFRYTEVNTVFLKA